MRLWLSVRALKCDILLSSAACGMFKSYKGHILLAAVAGSGTGGSSADAMHFQRNVTFGVNNEG